MSLNSIHELIQPVLIYIFIAFLLQILTKIPLALAQYKAGYNNHHPREQQNQLQGWGKRAHGAHLNTFEAFPGFAIGAVIAALWGPQDIIQPLCLTFLIARIVYVVCYLADISTLRTLVWGVGYFATLGLYILPWLKLS